MLIVALYSWNDGMVLAVGVPGPFYGFGSTAHKACGMVADLALLDYREAVHLSPGLPLQKWWDRSWATPRMCKAKLDQAQVKEFIMRSPCASLYVEHQRSAALVVLGIEVPELNGGDVVVVRQIMQARPDESPAAAVRDGDQSRCVQVSVQV